MTTIGFEQSKVDPGVFCKVVDKKVEIVMVIHVDDILARAKYQATMERFAANSGREGGDVKVPIPRGSGGAHMDGKDA